jgi:cystathionine beta-lyase/cystathionine gamma-synthase
MLLSLPEVTSSLSSLSPFDSWLVLRGIKTLAVRMERHCENAQELAGWLEKEPKVRKVSYPGLTSHPQYKLAKRQMGARFGGMVTVILDTDLAGTRRFLENTHLFSLAESLGGVVSVSSEPGRGSQFSVRFPMARREPARSA